MSDTSALMKMQVELGKLKSENARLQAERNDLEFSFENQSKACMELDQENERLTAALAQWREFAAQVGSALGCLHSNFADGNGHIVDNANKLRGKLHEAAQVIQAASLCTRNRPCEQEHDRPIYLFLHDWLQRHLALLATDPPAAEGQGCPRTNWTATRGLPCPQCATEPEARDVGELTFRRLQREQIPWVQHNFPGRDTYCPLLGATEEIGELAHAHLKQLQGIRGTFEEHHAAKVDAVADVVIFLSDYCTANGIDFQDAVETTWAKVRQRDFQADPKNGGEVKE